MNISDMRKIAEARTKGPWSLKIDPRDEEDLAIEVEPKYLISVDGNEHFLSSKEFYPSVPKRKEDWKFIAMAANTYDALLDVAEAAREVSCDGASDMGCGMNTTKLDLALKKLEEI